MYHRMFVLPQIHLLKPNPQCDSTQRWTFERCLNHEVGALMMGLAHLLETPESFLSPSAM